MSHPDDLRLMHWLHRLRIQTGTFTTRTARIVLALIILLSRVPWHATTLRRITTSSAALFVVVIHIIIIITVIPRKLLRFSILIVIVVMRMRIRIRMRVLRQWGLLHQLLLLRVLLALVGTVVASTTRRTSHSRILRIYATIVRATVVVRGRARGIISATKNITTLHVLSQLRTTASAVATSLQLGRGQRGAESVVTVRAFSIVRVMMWRPLSPTPSTGTIIPAIPIVTNGAVQMRLQRMIRAIRAARVDSVRVTVVRGIPLRIGQQWRLRWGQCVTATALTLLRLLLVLLLSRTSFRGELVRVVAILVRYTPTDTARWTTAAITANAATA